MNKNYLVISKKILIVCFLLSVLCMCFALQYDSAPTLMANAQDVMLGYDQITIDHINYNQHLVDIYYESVYDGYTHDEGGYDLDLREYTIYGGSKTDNVESTYIETIGGQVGTIYGGGKHRDVTDNTTVHVKGGTVGKIYGGGVQGNVLGKTNIVMTGGSAYSLKGNSFGAVGRATITLDGEDAVVNYIAGVAELVEGTGNLEDNVVEIFVKNGTVNEELCGATAYAKTIHGSILIEISSGEVSEILCAAERGGDIRGNITLNLRGGTVKDSDEKWGKHGDNLNINIELDSDLYVSDVIGSEKDSTILSAITSFEAGEYSVIYTGNPYIGTKVLYVADGVDIVGEVEDSRYILEPSSANAKLLLQDMLDTMPRGLPVGAVMTLLDTLDFNEDAPKDSVVQYRCTACGYVHDGQLPVGYTCPKCIQPASMFVKIEQ